MSTNMRDDADRLSALSQRESTILQLASEGLTDKEIAQALGVSATTVRTYWDRLRNKLKATNRAHAVALGTPQNDLDRAAEEMNSFIVRNLEDTAIFCCDAQGVITTWNHGVEKLFGYTEEEWIGQHASIFFIATEKHEATRELADASHAGASVNDRWHMRKGGSRFWGTNTVLALPLPHSPGAFAKIVREKTHQPSR